jgi:hypothetical protein
MGDLHTNLKGMRERPGPGLRFGSLLGVAVVLFGVSSIQAQETPKWKFRAGTSFNLENVHSQKQTVKINDKVQKSESTTTWVTSIDVLKATDKEIVIEQTIVSVTAKEAKPNVTAEAWAAKMKGSKFQVTLSPTGRVLKFEGYEELVKKLNDPMHAKEDVAHFLVSESALRQTLEEMLGFLPDQPVAVGATWKRQAVESIAPFGSFETVFQYSLAGRRNDADVISFSIQASYVPPKNDLGVLRVVKGALKAEQGKGEIQFDLQKGRLIRGEKQMHIRGTLTLEAEPRQTVNMEFESDSTVSWRLIEK